MPLPAFVRDFFEGGNEAYQAAIDELGVLANAHYVPLWKSSALNLIPDDGWAEDGYHVDNQGALIFSAWLGAEVGQRLPQFPTQPDLAVD